MEVLEFGCGTGSTAIAHASYVKHILATDISPKMIEIARENAHANDVENVTFTVATIEALEASDNAFDAVLGLSILHLLEDKEAAIAKVHKLLRPGGVFVSNTVCLGDTMKWFRFIGPIGRALGLMPLVRIFTRNELEESLVTAGFEIEYAWQPDEGRVVFIVARRPA
jgi:ubiquinone/menaquinone biosynthesis C-methylase UbiE